MSVLIQRVLSALVLLPIVIGLAYLGGPYFAMCIGVAALLAGYEFYHIMWLGGYKPSYVVGLGLIAVLLFDVYYPHYGVWRWGVAAAVILLLLCHGFLLSGGHSCLHRDYAACSTFCLWARNGA